MITSVSTTTDTTAAAAAMKKSIGMDKDDFLNLFIEQLKNQDPLEPTDSDELLSQLSQLTQVEQAYNTNTNLEKLLAAQNNTTSMSAVSFIGKSVTANGDSINFDGASAPSLSYSLGASASSVTITISDSSGNTVRTMQAGSQSSGNNSYTWDGKNDSGATVESGAYSFAVAGTTSGGSSVTTTTYTSGLVTGVSLSSDTPSLTIGAVSVPMTDVLSVLAV